MKIKNAFIYIEGSFRQGDVIFDEKITALNFDPDNDSAEQDDEFCLDADGAYIIPGLIDIHTHGALGEDASDGSLEGLKILSGYYAEHGITSWCPTTMTLKEPELTKAMEAVAAFERPENGAKIAGVHLEGPFICYEKRGAQNPENIHTPDIDMLKRLNEASGSRIKLITMAPETEGAMEFIEQASKLCTVSLGHTMSDYDTAMKAYEKGASHTTHLYNAMPPLHHREPGVIGAAFDSNATAELITDGLHIHPSVVRMTAEMFGERTVIISDSLRCAGMPDGEIELGGQSVTVKDGKATLTGTDTLAGSSINLMEGMKRLVSFGIPLEKATYAATAAPAKVIGAEDEIGSLEPGHYADMVVLNSELDIVNVYVNGKQIL